MNTKYLKYADIKYQKYANIGGIKYLFNEFRSNRLSLPQITALTSYSIETIRQDLLSYKGISSYQEAIQHRKNLRKSLRKRKLSDVFDSCDELLLYLQDSLNSFNSAKIDNIKYLVSVAEARFQHINKVKFKNNCLILYDKKTICIKKGIAKKKSLDYQKGFYRFKISKELLQYDYIVFCIFVDNKNIFYIFSSKKLMKLQTLCLKIKPPLNIGKYSTNLNNWPVVGESRLRVWLS